jgi:circadian clock protein KaiB
VTSTLAGKPDLSQDTTVPIWKLRLYVAGQSPKSLQAAANLRRLCDAHIAGRYEIEVVDLTEQPARAQLDNIIAIPTLVRCTPAPQRRTIGDLSNSERVLTALELPAGPGS